MGEVHHLQKDVTVRAPAAEMVLGSAVQDLNKLLSKASEEHDISTEEMLKIAMGEVKRLNNELETMKVVASDMTNMVASLAKFVLASNGRPHDDHIRVPRELSDQMMGSYVTLSEIPVSRDIIVRFRERNVRNHVWEVN